MMKEIEEYVKENKDKLHSLAKHGDEVIAAMALALLKKGGEQE